MKITMLGGGVAGVGCAIALKLQGFDVEVYERHAAASNIGAGIVVWPNAAYVLDQLGVWSELESVSGQPSRMRRFSSDNEALGAIDIELINRRLGYPSLSVLRSDFLGILIARFESLGGAIRYAHDVAEIEAGLAGRARVRFGNGTWIEPDVVVGADGRMASHARRFVHGDATPVYQGFVNWVGVCESAEDTFEDIVVDDYWGVGERVGIVPVTRRKAYWAAGAACAEVGVSDRSRYRDELRSLLCRWPRRVRRIVERTPVERINKIHVHDHDPIRRWHRGNLILVGDAAHAPLPTSGQGACQALEDAWHLARYLKESPGDLQRAFAGFTQARLEKTTNIIMAGRGLAASLFNRDEGFCRARNESSRSTDYPALATAMARGWAQGLPIGA